MRRTKTPIFERIFLEKALNLKVRPWEVDQSDRYARIRAISKNGELAFSSGASYLWPD
jgi:hypothetical protein